MVRCVRILFFLIATLGQVAAADGCDYTQLKMDLKLSQERGTNTYRDGSLIQRVYDTPEGVEIIFVGTVHVDQGTFIIRNIAVASNEKYEKEVEVGNQKIFEAMKDIAKEVKEKGFTKITFEGQRITGRHKGKAFKRSFSLVEGDDFKVIPQKDN